MKACKTKDLLDGTRYYEYNRRDIPKCLQENWFANSLVVKSKKLCSLYFERYVKRRCRAMKMTFQPKKRSHAKVHGFRARMATAGGRKVLSARRAKGRKQISA